MSSELVRAAIEAQVQLLAGALHAGMGHSLGSAHRRLGGIDLAKYPHLLPFVLRADFRDFLEGQRLPDGWSVTGNSKAMGQLSLTHSGLDWTMQFLKERRATYPSGVPSAGRNTARRQRWMNDPLDLGYPDGGRGASDPINLLLLWDFLRPDEMAGFQLRVVHTIAAGNYGDPTPCDFWLEVQDGGNLHRHLKFAGAAEEENFFYEISEDENRGSQA